MSQDFFFLKSQNIQGKYFQLNLFQHFRANCGSAELQEIWMINNSEQPISGFITNLELVHATFGQCEHNHSFH